MRLAATYAEPGALTGLGLLLDRGDLDNLVLEAGGRLAVRSAEEEVEDLALLDRDGVYEGRRESTRE